MPVDASVDVTEARRAKLLKAEEMSDHGQRPWYLGWPPQGAIYVRLPPLGAYGAFRGNPCSAKVA